MAVQRGLEEMRDDLDNMNPAFTIRRQVAHAEEELEMMQQLRAVSAAPHSAENNRTFGHLCVSAFWSLFLKRAQETNSAMYQQLVK